MSWSVSASGSPAEAKEQLLKQFEYPLADGKAGLADDGEKETVRKVSALIDQCLDTFGPRKSVTVTASGHMGFDDWDSKEGAHQYVSISITPA
jgi:hypothetical protein